MSRISPTPFCCYILAWDAPLLQAEEGPQPAVTEPTTGMFSTEVWLTPLILLPGFALLIVSTSARFSQLHMEFHRLLDRPDAHARILSRHLLKRSTQFRDALVALYASVALFALGSLLGAVVNLWRPKSLWVVGGATILGIACIVFAAVQLMREAMACLKITVDHAEQLQEFSTGDVEEVIDASE